MQIPVLIEPIAQNGFRAKAGEPLPLTAEGATRDEALRKLRDLLDCRVGNGTELVAVDVPTETSPWLAMAGMYDPNDPEVKEWEKEMAAYREEIENDPDAP